MKEVGYSIIEFSHNTLPVSKPCMVLSHELTVVITIAIMLLLSSFLIKSYFDIKDGIKEMFQNFKGHSTVE